MKKESRFLSLVLRHQPEKIGLKLDKAGWTSVSDLLQKMKLSGSEITLDDLKEIVETNDKKRFEFSKDLSKIRASQGHSVEVDLGLLSEIPPFTLYHGTSIDKVDSILKTGLQKRDRHHVHLSKDTITATSVGKRHGTPVLLEISSREMFTDGYKFYISANGVWLTDEIPTKYIKIWK